VSETRRRLLLNALKLFDLGLVIASFGVTVLVVYAQRGFLANFFSVRIKLSNFVIFFLIALAWHLIFHLGGMYGSKRLSTRRLEASDAFKVTTLCAVCLASAAKIFSVSMVTFRFSALFWILSSGFVILGRSSLRFFLATIRRRGHNLRYMLILGTNARAIKFAHGIEARPELGYRILGFVDEHWTKTGEFKEFGRTLACNFDVLPTFLRNNVVDEVVNYLPLRSFYEHASQVATLCELHGIILRFDADIFDLKIPGAQAGYFNGSHYIINNSGAINDGLPMMIKRGLDVLGSLLFLLILAPVFLVATLAIKLTSEGNVLFRQQRIGYNKRTFYVYKFRTMIPNAEKMMAELESLNELSGPVFKIKNDPRLTRIGKLLRRFSVDELPQLWNVLKGDMSLVGPRPLPVRDYQGFSKDWQRRRFSVRPGITCLWQVKGRCSITFEQWMKLDIQYLDEWSLWLDLKILVQTIPAVLKGLGAA
jgi:exopolysaccharide biosynthesis polyprenyl glycosylphosphotransferase